MRYKAPTKRSKYYLPGPVYRHATAFCECYKVWRDEIASYDLKPITGDTEGKRADRKRKIDIIEKAAAEVVKSETLRNLVILGLTTPLSYEELETINIPCGRRQYYEYRREIIYRVAKSI